MQRALSRFDPIPTIFPSTNILSSSMEALLGFHWYDNAWYVGLLSKGRVSMVQQRCSSLPPAKFFEEIAKGLRLKGNMSVQQ
jgi:hypothetical protein